MGDSGKTRHETTWNVSSNNDQSRLGSTPSDDTISAEAENEHRQTAPTADEV